jgi:5-methyltetrahydropteroyltriglutamate--homocysteine methyltransferase
MFDVPLKDIVDIMLQVNVGAYSFEAANVRHEHEWTVWKTAKLPAGKKILPGVISHATNVVEHPELIAQRLVRFANLVGREHVMASTDCGFAQSPFARRVHPTIMWAKLKCMAEGARLATQELWGKQAAA